MTVPIILTVGVRKTGLPSGSVKGDERDQNIGPLSELVISIRLKRSFLSNSTCSIPPDSTTGKYFSINEKEYTVYNMVDRLAYQCDKIPMNGKSYRIENRKSFLEETEK